MTNPVVFSNNQRESLWSAMDQYESDINLLVLNLRGAIQNEMPFEQEQEILAKMRTDLSALIKRNTEFVEMVANMIKKEDHEQVMATKTMTFDELLQKDNRSDLGMILCNHSLLLEDDDEDTEVKGLFLIDSNSFKPTTLFVGDHYHDHISDRIAGALRMLEILGIQTTIVENPVGDIKEEIESKIFMEGSK